VVDPVILDRLRVITGFVATKVYHTSSSSVPVHEVIPAIGSVVELLVAMLTVPLAPAQEEVLVGKYGVSTVALHGLSFEGGAMAVAFILTKTDPT